MSLCTSASYSFFFLFFFFVFLCVFYKWICAFLHVHHTKFLLQYTLFFASFLQFIHTFVSRNAVIISFTFFDYSVNITHLAPNVAPLFGFDLLTMDCLHFFNLLCLLADIICIHCFFKFNEPDISSYSNNSIIVYRYTVGKLMAFYF